MERFTIICDYKGGTYISQVQAIDAAQSVTTWAEFLRRERPIPDASELVAQAARENPTDIVPLDGLIGAWCWTGKADNDLILAHIIQSA